MKSLPNLARPDIAFCIPWLIVLAAYLPLVTPITPAMNPDVSAMLAFNLLSAPLILYLIKRHVNRRLGARQEIDRPSLSAADIRIMSRFLCGVMTIWGVCFVATIIYSGGLPIVWYMTGSTKTYADFGIPTIGGLVVLLRTFSASLSILLAVATRKKVYFLLWLVLVTCCVTEVSRSALFLLSCQSLAAFLLLQRLKLRNFLLTVVAAASLAGVFMLLGSVRGIDISASDFQIDQLSNIPAGVYGAWAYIVSPLGNVNYATTLGVHPLYYPANTFNSILPSALGLRTGQYPIQLASDSLNATSMYAPLIADFGILGGALLMSAFQAFASYAFVMARRGDILYIIFYPALFACLVLSIFYIYAASLQTILIPAVVIWMRRFRRRHIGVEASRNIRPAVAGNGAG